MSSASITGLYAGLLGILLIVLSFLVGRQRGKHKVSLGHGGIETLERAIRVHANFTEYVPLALLLLLAAELNHGSARMLHAYGIALVVGRIIHALGLSKTIAEGLGRGIGTTVTMLVLLGLAVVNVRLYWLG